jgi:hypothetical protein
LCPRLGNRSGHCKRQPGICAQDDSGLLDPTSCFDSADARELSLGRPLKDTVRADGSAQGDAGAGIVGHPAHSLRIGSQRVCPQKRKRLRQISFGVVSAVR